MKEHDIQEITVPTCEKKNNALVFSIEVIFVSEIVSYYTDALVAVKAGTEDLEKLHYWRNTRVIFLKHHG